MRFVPQRTDSGQQPQLAQQLEDFAKGEFDHPLGLQNALELYSAEHGLGLVVGLFNGAIHVSNAQGSLLKIRSVS